MTDELKTCTKCQASKPPSEFYENRTAASGLMSACKLCHRAAVSARQRLATERSRAKKRGEVVPDKPFAKSKFRIDQEGRQCTRCLTYKQWDEFHLDGKSRLGHQSTCIVCCSERNREAASRPEAREASARRQARYRERKLAAGWVPTRPAGHREAGCDGVKHRCFLCGELKAVQEFPGQANAPCGFGVRCKRCQLDRRRRIRADSQNGVRDRERLVYVFRRYRISPEDYLWLFEQQGGVCFLCQEPETMEMKGGLARLAIDHDHECHPAGQACKNCIRGLLCFSCNAGIGRFERKSATRERFADYLARRPFLDPNAP